MIEVMRKRKREGEFGIGTQPKISWYVRHERQAQAMQRPRSKYGAQNADSFVTKSYWKLAEDR